MFLKGRNSPVIGRLVNELGKGIVLDAVLEEGLEICISNPFTSSHFGNDFIKCKSPVIGLFLAVKTEIRFLANSVENKIINVRFF